MIRLQYHVYTIRMYKCHKQYCHLTAIWYMRLYAFRVSPIANATLDIGRKALNNTWQHFGKDAVR